MRAARLLRSREGETDTPPANHNLDDESEELARALMLSQFEYAEVGRIWLPLGVPERAARTDLVRGRHERAGGTYSNSNVVGGGRGVAGGGGNPPAARSRGGWVGRGVGGRGEEDDIQQAIELSLMHQEWKMPLSAHAPGAGVLGVAAHNGRASARDGRLHEGVSSGETGLRTGGRPLPRPTLPLRAANRVAASERGAVEGVGVGGGRGGGIGAATGHKGGGVSLTHTHGPARTRTQIREVNAVAAGRGRGGGRAAVVNVGRGRGTAAVAVLTERGRGACLNLETAGGGTPDSARSRVVGGGGRGSARDDVTIRETLVSFSLSFCLSLACSLALSLSCSLYLHLSLSCHPSNCLSLALHAGKMKIPTRFSKKIRM